MNTTHQFSLGPALTGACLGLALTVGYCYFRDEMPYAQARIAFPEARSMMRFEEGAAPDGDIARPEYYLWRSPATWVANTLRSPQAVDALCNLVRRASGDENPAAVRAAVLLLEENRLKIKPGKRDLTILVRAEEAATARLLCEGLLDYLGQQSTAVAEQQSVEAEKKIPAPDPGEWAQFVRQEKELGQQLARRTTETLGLGPQPQASSTPGAVGTQAPRGNSSAEAVRSLLALSKGSYAEKVRDFRQIQQAKLGARLRAASLAPIFIVVDPPIETRVDTYPPVLCFGGAALGALLGWALTAGQRQRAGKPGVRISRTR